MSALDAPESEPVAAASKVHVAGPIAADEPPARPAAAGQSRANAFGAFRLIFAALVIVSHSYEMLDGDQHREPLHRIFGHLAFGGVAVDGFFLISGYLIAGSFVSDPRGYFWKRILRIYPAFLVCSALCLFVVAPLAGGILTGHDLVRATWRAAMLKGPEVASGVFHGLPYPALNGSMWTISYEFRCYIAAALLGVAGVYRNRWVLGGLTALVLAATLLPPIHAPSIVQALIGDPTQDLRLWSAFLVGTSLKFLRPTFTNKRAAICGIVLLPLLFVAPVAEIALLTLGGYLLFWLALTTTWRPLLMLNAKDDISYGLYLYAWPAGALIIWYWRSVDPIVLGVLTLGLSVMFGWLSWHILEKRAMSLKGMRLNLFAPKARPSPAG